MRVRVRVRERERERVCVCVCVVVGASEVKIRIASPPGCSASTSARLPTWLFCQHFGQAALVQLHDEAQVARLQRDTTQLAAVPGNTAEGGWKGGAILKQYLAPGR